MVQLTESKDIKLDYSKYFSDIRTYPCPTATMFCTRTLDNMRGYGCTYAPWMVGNFGLFTTSSATPSVDA